MPCATPVTTPVLLTTVAIPALLLVQVPPEVVLARVVVFPAQTTAVPVIEAGAILTVTDRVAAVPHPFE